MSRIRVLLAAWPWLLLPAAILALVLSARALQQRWEAERESSELLAPPVAAADMPARVSANPGPGGPTGGGTAPDSLAESAADSADVSPLVSDWTSYADALAQSRQNDKPILLSFDSEGCESCDRLRHEVFDDPAAGTTVEVAVIPVRLRDRVNEDEGERRSPDVDQLKSRFKVQTFPTLVVFSPASGRVRTLRGWHGVDETLRFVTEAADSVF